MRLLKVVYTMYQQDVSVFIDLGHTTLNFLGLLERTPNVVSYKVYDLEIMGQMIPSQYGWGGLPKWVLPEWALAKKEETNGD